LFHRKRTKVERDRQIDSKLPPKAVVSEPKAKSQAQIVSEEIQDQKVKLTQKASSSPELQRKKLNKEGNLQGKLDKGREVSMLI